jgi:hypothetical protein
MRICCPKSEYLEISSEMMAFAKEVLSSNEIEAAEKLSLNLSEKSTRLNAQRILKDMIGVRPKRPIYYANCEIDRLPRWTRYAIENLGHFIDILVKCVASEKLSNPKCHELPFGTNLTKLKNVIANDLYSELDKFNKLIYRRAKHDFNVVGRSHLFTSKEVVFTIFITMNLKEKLISISEEAKKYNDEKIPFFPNLVND